MRLDVFIAEKGLAKTRTRALNLIRINAVTVDGKTVNKPSYDVTDGQIVDVNDKIKYCSLGGLKLEKAIEHFKLKIAGIAIDIGASNGGFTHCLLNYGVQKVYAVDVGANALPDELTNDNRVIVMDKTNARNLEPSNFEEKANIITIDVSFISLTQILPVTLNLLSDEGIIIALIKPQFEVGKSALTKSGIVKSEKLRQKAIEKVIEAAKYNGLTCLGYTQAPLLFEDKNVEYLALFNKLSNL